MLDGCGPCRCHTCVACQALAKIAVRSGEPFRVQCYQILAAAAGGSVAHRNRGSSRGGTSLAPAAAAGKVAVAAKAAAASAAAESAAGDPLGVAAVVGPALEVLDHIYASKPLHCFFSLMLLVSQFLTVETVMVELKGASLRVVLGPACCHTSDMLAMLLLDKGVGTCPTPSFV